MKTEKTASSPAPAPADGLVTVEVTVHARKTVIYSKQVGTKQLPDGRVVPNMIQVTAQANETIQVSPEDAEFLRTHGFLQDPDDPRSMPAPPPDLSAPQRFLANSDPNNPTGVGQLNPGRTW